jgi:hypothetical protein
MPIWLWVVVAICIALTALAVIARARKPKEFDPVDLEFDMRALKQANTESAKALKIARTRELAERQHSSSKTKIDDDDPPIPGFFG